MIVRRLSPARTIAVCVPLALAALVSTVPSAQVRRRTMSVSPQSRRELREWDAETSSMLRSGELRIRQTRADTLLPGRLTRRADQYYKGIRVFGGDVAVQAEGGVTIEIFGRLYTGIDVGTGPSLSEEQARSRIATLAGNEPPPDSRPELMVLPLDPPNADTGATEYRLVWRMRAVTGQADIVQYFLDAATGDLVLHYSDRQTQSAVGRARGVLGDSKKISVSGSGGPFTANDLLRPPAITTYDMKGDPIRTENFLLGRVQLGDGDIASDDDNDWTDGSVDDAHVYAGWTYDYYFKRFGRHGLDNNNIRMRSLANPVRRLDLTTYFNQFPDFFLNAFYAGSGVMVYGVGLPPGFTVDSPVGRQSWDFTSGALDVVAHELTHGVTEFTSNLIYRNESGALNEAFSDMMGTSVEFFYQPPGGGPMTADYLIGEDVVRPGGLRSLASPSQFGDPDNYSRRLLGADDNGFVHSNSLIAGHAFYLTIEGGTNLTSGLTVRGVGGNNREQVEKVFYRAFTQLLPSSATFALTRTATIQAARDLYGANSDVERALTDAWTAVGVN
ncbi:MAG TPA: M4 family metallopeptidase [Vicinamibacterales bacterium]